MSATITPAAFAELVSSDGRTVRKFLRSITPKDEQPGKGSRWALPGTKRDITKLQKQFNTWTEAQETARQERAEKAAAEVEETEDEVNEDEVLEVEEPTEDVVPHLYVHYDDGRARGWYASIPGGHCSAQGRSHADGVCGVLRGARAKINASIPQGPCCPQNRRARPERPPVGGPSGGVSRRQGRRRSPRASRRSPSARVPQTRRRSAS